MRTLLLIALVLTTAVIALPPAQAAQGPPSGSCNFATNPCPGGQLYCRWYSLEVPFCIDNPFR